MSHPAVRSLSINSDGMEDLQPKLTLISLDSFMVVVSDCPFSGSMAEGVHTIQRNPNVAYGVLGVTTILALRSKFWKFTLYVPLSLENSVAMIS